MGEVINANSLLVKTDKQPANVVFFNNLITSFCNAINGIGVRMDGYDTAEQNLVELGLANINATLGPFLTTLQEAAQLGFLVAEADGRLVQLAVGQPFDLILTSTGASLFTPTKWLMALDVNDSTNWGVLQVVSWVQQDLNLATTCVYATKTQASSSWQVCCGSAVLEAMVNDLNAATTAANNAQTANNAAQAAAAYVSGVQTSISAGPVISVAGKTGAVSLAESDIANLAADLAARPLTSFVTSQLAGKQNTSTTLNALAALTYSAFILAFLGAIDAPTARSTLGLGDAAIHPASDFATPTSVTAAISGSKASVSDIATGTDDTRYATAAGIAATYSPKTLQWSVAQAAGFTLGATFNGQAIPWTASGAGTITLANNAPAGTECMISCEGVGQITFIAQAGGSVQSRGARLKSNGQYSMITAMVFSNSGTNAAWRLGGDLTT